MENEQLMKEEVKKLRRDNLRMNIVLTLALLAMCIVAGASRIINTRLTEKTLEISQRVGVEFNTKTNSIFGLWRTVSPR